MKDGDDATDIFDDLDKLRADSGSPASGGDGSKSIKRKRPARRDKIGEPFAPIPYDRARKLFRHIGGPAWMLLIELDRLIFESGGFNPIQLTTEALEGSGLTRWQKERGLWLLEQAGIITVERKSGRCPLVTLLWYPVKK